MLLLQCYVTRMSFGHMMVTGKFPQHPFFFCSHQLNPTKLQKHLLKILQTGQMMFFTIHIYAATSGLVNTIFVKRRKSIYQFNVQHKPKSKIWKDVSQVPCILLRSCLRSCAQQLTVSMTQTINQQAKLDQHFTLFNYQKKRDKRRILI